MSLRKYLKNCNEVYHTTLDPNTAGVVRIHLVPPKKLKPSVPWLVIFNGYSVLPLQSAWAVLLKEFIEVLNQYEGKTSISDDEIEKLLKTTLERVKGIFPKTDEKYLKADLKEIIGTFQDIARGKEPNSVIGYMTFAKYAKYMKAPHRMDLMVSAMEKNGCWNCNQHCLHCYAADEVKSKEKELTKEQWFHIIDECKKAGIPSLTFTGGEATIRDDLVDLIEHAKWFVTRLNTNGILLTKELCEKLYKASLDSVQVTLYSYDEEIHNTLVGGNHFKQTVEGIKNAIEAGLDVSINTPLCSLNKDYDKTMEFAYLLGVKYFSCSGLILTGNAKTQESKITRLTKKEISRIVQRAVQYAKAARKDLEVSFTSPGWIDEKDLRMLRMVVPSCGACLSNMAIAPNGDVIPCQSWLSGIHLGNLLKDDFQTIWKNKECQNIRARACKNKNICLLKEEEMK
ncbi:MAG: radical SAM protein [Anaeroplasmataceae bacterium]|nr:radical SAM protein [Anaeroplasmataceae bacterium]